MTSQENVKILGVVNGDPFDRGTWSGCSYYLFNALDQKGLLYEAVSAEPSPSLSALHKLLSVHPNRATWRLKYGLGAGYRTQMTKTALRRIAALDRDGYNVILQAGAWYNLTGQSGKLTVSYHDANIATYLGSRLPLPRLPARFVRSAWDFESAIYRNSHCLFTMSAWVADSFVRDFGVSARKIAPVGAGVNLPADPQVEHKRYDQREILFVGWDFERKGGPTLLEAFSRVRREIPDASLTLVGPRGLKDLPEGVRSLGYVPKNTDEGLRRLLAAYQSASVFAMPSLYEPFGIVFLEAMANRLPCIGADVCAMPEIIEDGITGYIVAPGDSRTLACRLIELLKEPQTCYAMGERARARYLQNYTWDVVTNKILERINQLP